MTPDKSADKLTTEELYQRILAYDLAYRNDTPIVSDAVFDALVEMLRGRDPNHAYFAVVGAAPSVSSPWVKVQHSIPMGSLDKVQTPDEMVKWWPNQPHQQVCTTHKLDGISCFDGATPVYLANGETLPIQEIVERGLRPQVLTWSPEEGVTTRQVTNTFDNGDRDNWVRLTLEDGSTVVVTEDHRFYVIGEGWVLAKDLLGKDLQDSQE